MASFSPFADVKEQSGAPSGRREIRDLAFALVPAVSSSVSLSGMKPKRSHHTSICVSMSMVWFGGWACIGEAAVAWWEDRFSVER